MNRWKQYIDTRFINPDTLKTRDRAPAVCPKCNVVTVVYVSNLKARIKKYGDYECRSCMGKKVWEENKEKIKNTLQNRYGVDNPGQVAGAVKMTFKIDGKIVMKGYKLKVCGRKK